MRRSLRLLLDGEVGLELVGDAANIGAVLSHVHVHQPRVLVLDLGMPGVTGLETIQRLRADAPSTAIVVMTMQDDPRHARDALAAGATGYVLTDRADEDLPNAIRHASVGECFVTPSVAAGLIAHGVGVADALTQRQLDVLHLVASGSTNAEIASRLRVAVHLVESERAGILRKLGLDSRSELVRFTLERVC